MSKTMKRTAATSLLLCSLLAAAAWAGDDTKSFSIGLQATEHATLADLGLPGYPGAALYTESQGDKPAVKLGAWAGVFGLRVSAMKFQSADSPADVAAFYAKALGKHGAVLDCREPAARVKPPEDSDKLSCDEKAPRSGEFEFRVGTAKQFRVVNIKPHGDGARFGIARIAIGN